jgi:hypothetical protein
MKGFKMTKEIADFDGILTEIEVEDKRTRTQICCLFAILIVALNTIEFFSQLN